MLVECELCESWEIEDEKTFVFRLRQDVQWQDASPVDGRNLTGEDIAFSYNRQRQPGAPNAPLLFAIGDVELIGPNTLRIFLEAPDADFLASLADGHSKIVAREAVEVNGNLENGPTIGSGPWILTGTQPGALHTFTRNPAYFEWDLPFVEHLKIHVIPDTATRDAAFRVNALDVQQMGPEEWQDFRERRPDMPVTMISEPGTGLEAALKTSAPPFDDPRIRRAVLLSMDPWQAIADIWSGSAFVSLGSPVVAPNWLLPMDELQQFFGQPQLARDLVEETGVQTPVPVVIKAGDFGPQYLDHAQRIASEMNSVGFDATVEVLNRRVYGEEVWLGGDYSMFVGPTAPVATPNGYLLPVLHSRGQWNTTEHHNEVLDALIEGQAGEYDMAVRREAFLEIQRTALEQAYRFMPATRVSVWTWWPRVQNFYPNFAGSEYFHWARVWVND